MIELNKVYCMDNLELLKQMEDKSVDLIYCDILYGTGRKFKDYDDLKPNKDIILDFYMPRLLEMKRVMRDTGIIYLQCDYKISHWIRCMMDDLFGYDSIINEVIWRYKGIKRVTSKKFPQKHDIIISYSKSNKYVWNVQYKPHNKDYIKRFKKDENGRLYRDDVNPTGGGKRTIYLDETSGDIVDSVWDDINVINPMAKERVGYDTQKPKALLERIIKSSSSEGDVIADFFCGSGTTLVVAKELNRKYIGCDINPRAIEISNERLDLN